MGLGQIPLWPFVTFGRATAAENNPAVTPGAATGPWGTNRNIMTGWRTYRETIIEPRQTDKDTKT